MATKIADKQKCPIGHVVDIKEIVPDMESVIVIAERMDYGGPEVQCPVCSEWYKLQSEAEDGN